MVTTASWLSSYPIKEPRSLSNFFAGPLGNLAFDGAQLMNILNVFRAISRVFLCSYCFLMAALNRLGEYLTLRPALSSVSAAPRSCPVAAGARRRTTISAALRIQRTSEEETNEETLTGEWPGNFSMLNFEDLTLYLAPEIFKPEADPSSSLADVMSALRFSATKDTLLEEVEPCFLEVSGLPVLDKDRRCVGVVSKKDLAKASNGLKSRVSEVMTTPAITLSADKTVSDAAVTMLKHKIHRIPVTNDENQVIGMVTRTDIFTALEGK